MSRWLIDPDHTVATFTVRHMTVADVHGHFNRIAGELIFDAARPAATALEAVIETEGICTGIQKRDEHLRSADFFDVATFPHIIFKSTGADAEGTELRRLRGELFIHGVTRPVALEVERFGPARSTDGDTSLGLRLSTRVKREDYGMTWNVPIVGGLMVGSEVRIVVDVEADLAEG
ncbi:MAG TPA: YceI family protein [bacterium]